MRRLLLALAALASTLGPAAAQASVSNDAFADALPITNLPFSAVIDTTTAMTEQTDPGNACAYAYKTIWFRFQPIEDVEVEIDTAGTEFATIATVFVGPDYLHLRQDVCGSNDLWRESTTAIRFGAQAEMTYYIQIGGSASGFPPETTGPSGLLKVNARVEPGPIAYRPPLNDNLADATMIDDLPFNDSVYVSSASYGATNPTLLGTPSPPNPTPNNTYGDVWYRWTAPRDGMLAVTTERNPDGGVSFEIYQQGTLGLESVATGRQGTGSSNDYIFSTLVMVESARPYWINVQGGRGHFDSPGILDVEWAPSVDLTVSNLSVDDAGPTGRGTIGFDWSSPLSRAHWTLAMCPDGLTEAACRPWHQEDDWTMWGTRKHVGLSWRSAGCVGDWTLKVTVSWVVDDPNPANNIASVHLHLPGGGLGLGGGACQYLDTFG